MTFRELEKFTEGKELPLFCHNEDKEVVVVEEGCREGERFFRLTTAQHNDWCRINVYWEDGTVEEMYRK